MQPILLILCLLVGTVWSTPPSGYVPIPTADCASTQQVAFHAWASQWPVGSVAGQVSLYFEFQANTAINGGNYSAIVRWNGAPVFFSADKNQALTSYTGVWPIPNGFSYSYPYPNVALVTLGSFNVITFDFRAVDQNGVSLMCVTNAAFTPPSGVVSIPLASCADSAPVQVSAWASSWPPAQGPVLNLAFSVQTSVAVTGGTYDLSVKSSLGTTIDSASGPISDLCYSYLYPWITNAYAYCPWPIPAGFNSAFGLQLDTTALPPGATINFALSARDQNGVQIMCLVNGSAKLAVAHVSMVAIAVSVFLLAGNHLF